MSATQVYTVEIGTEASIREIVQMDDMFRNNGYKTEVDLSEMVMFVDREENDG